MCDLTDELREEPSKWESGGMDS